MAVPASSVLATPAVLILGAASDIGRAVAREYAHAGRTLILAARDPGRLSADAADLRLRFGVRVQVAAFDILDTAGHERFLDGLSDLPETVVCVVGLLGNQSLSQADAQAADLVFRTNYVGPAMILGMIANRMERRGHGCIIGISSVAGDRGRASNYVYGSAKAGLTAFLSGLRGRLAKTGVRVVTIKPGFCRTRMTAGLDLPKLLTAEPVEVARAIVSAERTKRDIVYVRPVWRLIMTIIGVMPEFVFKRLRL